MPPKESRPQAPGVARRRFLKTLPAAVAAGIAAPAVARQAPP